MWYKSKHVGTYIQIHRHERRIRRKKRRRKKKKKREEGGSRRRKWETKKIDNISGDYQKGFISYF